MTHSIKKSKNVNVPLPFVFYRFLIVPRPLPKKEKLIVLLSYRYSTSFVFGAFPLPFSYQRCFIVPRPLPSLDRYRPSTVTVPRPLPSLDRYKSCTRLWLQLFLWLLYNWHGKVRLNTKKKQERFGFIFLINIWFYISLKNIRIHNLLFVFMKK